jgi:hypothetical protein
MTIESGDMNPQTSAPTENSPSSLRGRLTGEFQVALCDALRITIDDDPSLRLEVVRRAAVTVVVQARSDGIQIERALISLKEAWAQIPETKQMSDQSREDVLASVVTSSIKSYYDAS